MLQLLLVADMVAKKRHIEGDDRLWLQAQFLLGAAGLVIFLAPSILPEGFIGPLSARVRGLFLTHTKTGNPLVDSVAEHQSTPSYVESNRRVERRGHILFTTCCVLRAACCVLLCRVWCMVYGVWCMVCGVCVCV